jgi:hypothetical protein
MAGHSCEDPGPSAGVAEGARETCVPTQAAWDSRSTRRGIPLEAGQYIEPCSTQLFGPAAGACLLEASGGLDAAPSHKILSSVSVVTGAAARAENCHGHVADRGSQNQ